MRFVWNEKNSLKLINGEVYGSIDVRTVFVLRSQQWIIIIYKHTSLQTISLFFIFCKRMKITIKKKQNSMQQVEAAEFKPRIDERSK